MRYGVLILADRHWRESLAGGNDASPSVESHQVVVHVEACALGGQGGEADLPLPTVKRLCCDGSCYFARPNGRPVEAPSAEDRTWVESLSAEDENEVRELRAVYRLGGGRT